MNPPLRLLLGGDVMLARLVTDVLSRNGPGYPLAALAEIRQRNDVFLANLECALSARPAYFSGAAKAFYFRAEPEAVRVLEMAGVTLVSLANNHVLDAGCDGLSDTLAILDRHDIASAGAGPDLAAATAVRVLPCQGQRLGVLAVCDHQADFAATAERAGIYYLDLRDAGMRWALLERVRVEAAKVDHLIVSLHWLPNWVPAVPEFSRQLAAELLEAGARVLWGHSPHHILGSQWLGGGVVLYSTGDLIDDYALDPVYRNDRQLLYEVELGAGRVEHLYAFPIQLRVGCAEPACAAARVWIARWLHDACLPLGSVAVAGTDRCWEILPASEAGERGRRV